MYILFWNFLKNILIIIIIFKINFTSNKEYSTVSNVKGLIIHYI